MHAHVANTIIDTVHAQAAACTNLAKAGMRTTEIQEGEREGEVEIDCYSHIVCFLLCRSIEILLPVAAALKIRRLRGPTLGHLQLPRTDKIPLAERIRRDLQTVRYTK